MLVEGTWIWITEPGCEGSRSVRVSLNKYSELDGALEFIESLLQLL